MHERSSEKSNELTDQQGMFRFNHVSAFYTSNNIVKNRVEIQGTNSNRKSYRKSPLPTFSVTYFKQVM